MEAPRPQARTAKRREGAACRLGKSVGTAKSADDENPRRMVGRGKKMERNRALERAQQYLTWAGPHGVPNLQCGEITLPTGIGCACGGTKGGDGANQPAPKTRADGDRDALRNEGTAERLGKEAPGAIFFLLFPSLLPSSSLARWRHMQWAVPSLLARSVRGPCVLVGNVAHFPHLPDITGASMPFPRRSAVQYSRRSGASRNVTTRARNPSEPRVTATEGAKSLRKWKAGGEQRPGGE